VRNHIVRSGIASIAALTLASGISACGSGGGGTTPNLPASATTTGGSAHPVGAPHALGFKNANPADIARLTPRTNGLSTVYLPPSVDLSAEMPPVGDQGSEGSCVAWATAYAMRGYEARRDVWSSVTPQSTDPSFNFSPAFVYNQLNGGKDDGLVITSALGLLQNTGAATLADMPYVEGQYTTQPSAAAISDAANYKLSTYAYIAPTNLTAIKTQLAEGLPVILAIKVYYNFFNLGSNKIYTATSGAYQGGHAIAIVGYSNSKGAIEIINSWGSSWGTAGYGWISYAMLNKIGVEAYSAVDTYGYPSPSPSPSPSPTPTPKPSPTPTPKPSPTPTPKPSPTATPKK
jgi:C1A family cysteine protease